MSRRSPTGFVFSVAAEVIAVVFIVSVLPRVDLRRSAGASSTSSQPSIPANDAPSLLPLPANWAAPVEPQRQPQRQPQRETQRERPTHETSYYQRRSPAADSFSITPPAARSEARLREPAPLISVDPARPDYVEERLDRASQNLVNSVGSYMSQAASDLLQVQPPAPTLPHSPPPSAHAPSISRVPPAAIRVPALTSSSPTPGSFPTQPQAAPPTQPRPWVRY